MADLMRCWASVFPLVQATRALSPEPLMTPSTRFARVSSIYGKVIKEGIAMGNLVAPAVAIVYLDRFKRLSLDRADLKPDFLVRYIDDYAGVWLHGKETGRFRFVSKWRR